LSIRHRQSPRPARDGAARPGGQRGRAGLGLFLFLLGVAVGAAGAWLAGRTPGWRALVTAGGAAGSGEPASEADDRRPPAPPARAGDRRAADRRPSEAGRAATAPGSGRAAAGAAAAARAGGSAGIATGAGEENGGGAAGGTAAARAGSFAPPAWDGPPRVALVIDDLGRSLEDVDRLRRLGVPITYAVLPFESQTPEVVAALRERHEEILCHLPMEPSRGGNPGPGALRTGMSSEQLRQSTLAAIAAVPGAAGVNNHMGSGLSADPASMAAILGVLAARGLYFLDSRTSAQSVGFRIATALGVPAAERQVFLDDDPRPEAVAAQFQRLLELAQSRGGAIAIGHPHPATLATLAAEVPRAQAGGIRFVQVSALLAYPGATPAGGR
jgi:polysaccharide deacetylase 2 family uncharacterized protein YibQ